MGLQSDVSKRPKLSTFSIRTSFRFRHWSCNERNLRIKYLIGSVEVVWVEQGAKALDCGRIKLDYCATPVCDKVKHLRTWDMVIGQVGLKKKEKSN